MQTFVHLAVTFVDRGKKGLTKSNVKTMKLIPIQTENEHSLSLFFTKQHKNEDEEKEDLIRYTLEFEFEFINCFEIVVMRSIRIFFCCCLHKKFHGNIHPNR